MYSFSFPNMFTTKNSVLLKDHDATRSNLQLLLNANCNGLFGDPLFGTDLIKYIYEQNDDLIVELIVDQIYSAIQTFIPQLVVNRKDIKIIQTKTSIKVEIKALNKIDYQTDLYNIELLNSD